MEPRNKRDVFLRCEATPENDPFLPFVFDRKMFLVPTPPGEYQLYITAINRQTTGIIYKSVIEEAGAEATKGQPFSEYIPLTGSSAQYHLDLFLSCFGVQAGWQELERTGGRIDPATLIGKRYRVQVQVKNSYPVVVSRRSAGTTSTPYRG